MVAIVVNRASFQDHMVRKITEAERRCAMIRGARPAMQTAKILDTARLGFTIRLTGES
jgi:hypothetical protein